MNILFLAPRKASDHRNCKVLLPVAARSQEGAAAQHLPQLLGLVGKISGLGLVRKISIMETVSLWRNTSLATRSTVQEKQKASACSHK